MGTVPAGSAEERLRRARAALVRAEEQAGLRSVSQRTFSRDASARALPVEGSVPADGGDIRGGGASSGGVGLGVVTGGPLAVDEGVPAPSADGVGVAGAVLEVGSGTGFLLRAAAGVAPSQGWIGFVGVRDIGWLAAREAGIDLVRVVSVPEPGPLAADVVATLLDGVDVLCVDGVDLSSSQQRRLAARVRRDGRVVLTTRAWPGVSRPHRPAAPRTREEAV